MSSQLNKPFEKPILITRPILPDISRLIEKLSTIWETKWFTNNGPLHCQLEVALQQILKVPFLSLFNNGTIALIVACQSQGLRGNVITTPFTFPATPHVLTWNNITPVFCDINPISMNIDVDKIESMITPETTGILAVHVFGNPCEVHKIQDIADRYSLKVIYDAAHAFGVELDGVGIGTFGDISMLSFHATKLFHTAEGGALTINTKMLKEKIDLLKNFGIKNEEEVIMPGINGKMSEIQAALGLAVLGCLDEEYRKRQKIVKKYQECLDCTAGITYNITPSTVKNNYQYFVLRIDRNLFGCSRDEVYEKLKEYNIFTRKYFYPLCSEYECYSALPSAQKKYLPVAHKVVSEVLTMPLYGDLSLDDVEKICEILISLGEK